MVRISVLTALGALAAVSISSQCLAQDDAGQLLFNGKCRTCHTLNEGDNRLGPSLAGVVGRKAGSLPGFGYSDAMRSSGITWDEATLDPFIAHPDEVVPGNRMKPYGGVESAEERAKLIAFLKEQGG